MPALIKDHTSTRLWRKLSTVFAAGAAVLLVATGASAAAPQPAQLPGKALPLPDDFPEPGTVLQLPIRVESWTLNIPADDPSASSAAEQGNPGAQVEDDSVMEVAMSPDSPAEGASVMEVDAPDPEQAGGLSIPIELLHFRLESEPGSAGDDPNGTEPPEQDATSFLFELDDQCDVPDSTLTQVGQAWEQSIPLNFTLTITNPPAEWGLAAGGEESELLVLATKEPSVLVGSLTSFPPKGDLYQLENPIDLVLPEDPAATVATIDKFPVQIGGI